MTPPPPPAEEGSMGTEPLEPRPCFRRVSRALFSHFQTGTQPLYQVWIPRAQGSGSKSARPRKQCTLNFTSWEVPIQGPSPQPWGEGGHKSSFRPRLPCLRGRGLGKRGLVRSCRGKGFLGGNVFLRGAPRGGVSGGDRVKVFLGEETRPASLQGTGAFQGRGQWLAA